MRHFEVVFMVHPDQSDQVPAMIERYRNIICEREGKIHRLENWGRRQLAYPVNKIHKAHYVLLNIECDQQTLAELKHAFKFNDAVLRHLIIRCKQAVTQPSPLAKGGYDKQTAGAQTQASSSKSKRSTAAVTEKIVAEAELSSESAVAADTTTVEEAEITQNAENITAEDIAADATEESKGE